MRDPIKIILGESEMAAVIDVFRVFEVGFRSGLLKAEVWQGVLSWYPGYTSFMANPRDCASII